MLRQVVCTYSCFQEDDILKFGFDLFDEDGSGTIDEYEMKRLVEKVNGGGEGEEDEPPNGNLKKAIELIDKDGDGLLDFFEFVKLCKHLPLILYPAFRLQKVRYVASVRVRFCVGLAGPLFDVGPLTAVIFWILFSCGYQVIQKKTLGEARWGFVLWNLNRAKRVTEYMATHHGRRPAGDFKASTRVLLESSCGCCGWPKLPETFPEYIDGLRPAAMTRDTGAYGGGFEKRQGVNLSQFEPTSF